LALGGLAAVKVKAASGDEVGRRMGDISVSIPAGGV
jgi:hypothetical protein